MRKTLFVLIIVAGLATAALWVYQTRIAQAEEPAAQREEHTVRRGSLVGLVNTTGTVLPEKQTALAFAGTGRVAEVLVQEGQMVEAGEPLARLETTELDASVSEAEMGLELAQAQLLRLQTPPSDYDIAAAQAALDSAQAAYDRLMAGASDQEVEVARANLAQAEAALKQAQAMYDRVKDRPDVAMLPESLQLEQATIAYRTAKASFDLTQRAPSAAERSAAQANIAQAQAALLRLQEGVPEADLTIAQLQVEQAQARLDQARRLVENATLTAPYAGTVTTVGIQAGELAGLQPEPAFVVSDLSGYHVEATVDEIDIGRLETGQPVTVTLDALPGEALRGRISQMAATADTQSQLTAGVVSYAVEVELEPASAPLRAGMTANVDVVTERRDGILLVPNRFVRVDRTSGRTYVDRLAGGEVQAVEIEIGLRDEFYSEVLAGLDEDDVIVLVTETSGEQLRRLMGPPQ